MNTIVYPKAKLNQNSLIFETNDGWEQCFERGAFYVEIPENFDLDALHKLVTSYSKDKDGGIDDAYKGYKNETFPGSLLGYSNSKDQVEYLQLEVNLWNQHFPEAASTALHQMNQLSKDVLKAVLLKAGVKETDLTNIVGNIDEDQALQYCILNLYRSSREEIGFTPHKDSGFITTLFSIEPGLEALEDGEWTPLDPVPGYFTINIGHSVEILTAQMETPIKAVYHRVRQTSNRSLNLPDRFSVGTYIGPRFDTNLYQYNREGDLDFYQTFMDFQLNKAKEMNYQFHPRLNAK